ncbi:hypothetical protein SCHIN_v1c06070 [Spiroplasma chinense]|uniref:Lipoprotein n=1 Tax=Spiroplasma chinense TaxID=216932 RepID=A0A5B9Y408_9MOLU|nr:lipoprotein [Spiroplasma chinense]QEH61804.1 hypothetical protein SCHIN_v1c06070 [Spiroplasma chinense]
MKKLLSLLAATGLVATTSATVVACGDKPAAGEDNGPVDTTTLTGKFTALVNEKIKDKKIKAVDAKTTVDEVIAEFSTSNEGAVIAEGTDPTAEGQIKISFEIKGTEGKSVENDATVTFTLTESKVKEATTFAEGDENETPGTDGEDTTPAFEWAESTALEVTFISIRETLEVSGTEFEASLTSIIDNKGLPEISILTEGVTLAVSGEVSLISINGKTPTEVEEGYIKLSVLSDGKTLDFNGGDARAEAGVYVWEINHGDFATLTITLTVVDDSKGE